MLHHALPFHSRVVVLFMMLLLTQVGCATIRRAPMDVPQTLSPLTDPATRLENYQKLFPELPILKTGMSKLIASRGRLPGKDNLQFILFAIDRNNLRLNVYYPLQLEPIFRVLVRDGSMIVVLNKTPETPGAVFQGVVGDQSPFGRKFGFEPWDMIPIFTVGQLVASGTFQSSDPNSLTLEPMNPETYPGLEKIVLDKNSGLPRRVIWRRPIEHRWWQLRKNAKLTVTYRAWKEFKDDKLPDAPARLLPASFLIASNAPSVRFDIDLFSGYRYSATVPPFTIDPNLPLLPLERLDEFFKRI